MVHITRAACKLHTIGDLGVKPTFCLVKHRVAGSFCKIFSLLIMLILDVFCTYQVFGVFICAIVEGTLKRKISCVSKLPITIKKKKKTLACEKAGCDDTLEFPAPAGCDFRFCCHLLRSSAFY